MKPGKLTEVQEQVLRDQVIDTERPGPVLRDFRTVLDFVGTEGVKAAGKYNLLPINSIGELDKRLTRPLRLELKRPQLRSHPYLQGLHLLLRASGLSRVEGSGDKARLVVDPEMLARWDRLNPTEQYFTLLEAWLLFGRPEMVGEQGRFDEAPLSSCLQTWSSIPARGSKFDLKNPQPYYLLGIGRDFYNLALMDLFGLLEVDHPKTAVQPWHPAGVRHVPFGDAVFTILWDEGFPYSRYYPSEEEGMEEEEAGDEEQAENEDGAEEEESFSAESYFGEWQPLFQPYFPEWRENLTFPEIAPREGTFVFRVALGEMWRRIALPADATLDDLVGWILRSVKFDSDHLYEFVYRDRFGATVRVGHPAMEEGPWTDEVTIGEWPLEPGQSMKLVYDFGDNWEFDVRLEKIEPPGAKIKAPRILERHGKAPEQYPNWDEW
jgi:hypothetical protein